jgi:hypothetical protein
MENKPIIEFFSNSSLKGSKFYFYCPNMKEKEKLLITNLIYDYGGKLSSRFNKNSIIIVESEEILASTQFLKLIEKYGDIYFNNNNHIEIIRHNSKNNRKVKIITFKELILEVAAFDNKSINYFFDRGLSKNINPEAIISLIINTNSSKNKTQLESYDFSYKDEKKNIFFDIPYFHKNTPEGFSVFCTDEEYGLVINHVNKKEYKLKQKNKNKMKNREEIITSEPEPTKKNYICQLCLIKFDNYKEHINSDEHNKNILENKNAFNKLTSTFKRIVDHNNNSIKTKDKLKKIGNNTFKGINLEKVKEKKDKNSYHLRKKNNIGYNKYKNENYVIYPQKNNSKIEEININNYPQPQVSSTASCTFKNATTCFEEYSDSNKIKEIDNKLKKRKRNKENEEFIYEEIYFKNKKAKI